MVKDSVTRDFKIINIRSHPDKTFSFNLLYSYIILLFIVKKKEERIWFVIHINCNYVDCYLFCESFFENKTGKF